MRDRLSNFVQSFPIVGGKRTDLLVDLDMFRSPGGRPRLPSDTEWRWTPDRLGTIEPLRFAEQQRENMERVLFRGAGGCRYCHVEKNQEAGAGFVGLPEFENSRLPARWMPRARFSHVKHRMLECTECHNAHNSSKTGDVLMPRLQSCQQCHNPEVAVRHDCVECHTYHDRTAARDPHRKRTIREILGR
jgi:predicted CXXCH cytochrome family protein